MNSYNVKKKNKCIIGKVQSYDDINYKFWIKLRPIKNGILKRSLIAKKSTTILESSLTFLKNKHWFYETNRYFLEALFWREHDTYISSFNLRVDNYHKQSLTIALSWQVNISLQPWSFLGTFSMIQRRAGVGQGREFSDSHAV